MAEETGSGAVEKKREDELSRVPADTLTAVPEAASARLAWHGSDGASMDYVARAGHVDVRSDAGALIGKMFALSYAKVGKSGEPDAARPVTFCFNGGPGSCSVPINFGGIGPVRVPVEGVEHLAATAPAEDNPHTLLVQSDLVFLDALGTGWSQLAEGVDAKKAWGVDADADCFARAIAAWLEGNGRWGSPVYLFGESYGTVRNAVLMRLLAERGIQPTGVVMLSAIFDWVQALPGQDLYFMGMVPTFAAAAQFHGRAGAGKDVDTWFDAACAFAEGEFATALLRGDQLPARQRAAVAKKLSRFIGLPQELIERRNLRIDLDTFRRSLLADEGLATGRLDTRFTADAPSTYQVSSLFFACEDAADDAIEGAYTAAFRAFVARLGYKNPLPYLVNNYVKVSEAWDWGHEQPGSDDGKLPCANVAHDIATALRRNTTCKLAILGGRYDAATTYWNVEHDIACQFLSPQARDRVEFHRYGCGHMAYTDEETCRAMAADMASFYAR